MNPINRIGQKIVCINDNWVEPFPNCGPHPVKDGVYTVSGFPTDGFLFVTGFERSDFGAKSYDITYFRPADERKTDISDLVKLTEIETIQSPDLVDA
jgi:hypothetical protein